MILNNLFWIENPSNRSAIKSALTKVAKAYVKEGEIVELYEEKGDWIGVPRMWGLGKFGGEYEDRTIFPYMEWPTPIVKYWPGQKEVVTLLRDKFLDDNKYGALLEAPCGSGKSACGLCIAAELNTPTLVLVHKEDLLRQWKEYADTYFSDVSVGVVQGPIKDYKDKHLVIATAQTLYIRQNEFDLDFWRTFGLVIYDEFTRYAARTFCYSVKMPQAKYRLGLSATFRRADGLECVCNWHIGNIEAKLKTYRLTGEYQIVRWNTKLQDSWFRLFNKKINTGRFITTLAKSLKYNIWLVQSIFNAVEAGRKVLLVSDRKDQISIIERLLREKGCESIGIYIGSKTPKELDDAKKCQIMLGTYAKLSEGTDVPELDTLFLATPRADIEQTVGRVLRVHKDKKPVIVIDPVFQTPYMRSLSKKRIDTYKKLDFKERINE